MSRRARRTTEFVCCSVLEGKSISKTIVIENADQAARVFESEFGVQPDSIYGPFFRKKTKPADYTREIVFANQSKKAIYQGWYVIASILNYPKGCAYLLFDRRLDGKKAPKPTETVIVKLEELKDY